MSIALLTPISFMRHTDPFIYTVGFSMAAASMGLLLLTAIHPTKPARRGVMAWLGTISYAFYLWHGPGLLMAERVISNRFWSGCGAFVATVLMAMASTKLVEEPFLRLRDRVYPSRSPKVYTEQAPTRAAA